MKYKPPFMDGNPTEFYELPDNDEILKDLRKCGGDVRLFLRKNIRREDRKEVLIQILERFEADPDAMTAFLTLRDLAQQGAVLEAEDHLLRCTRPGRENSLKAMEMALTNLDKEKWNSRRQSSQSSKAAADVRNYTKELQ